MYTVRRRWLDPCGGKKNKEIPHIVVDDEEADDDEAVDENTLLLQMLLQSFICMFLARRR